MPTDVQLLVSEAAMIFDAGEQPAADFPSYQLGADLVRERFKFREIVQAQQGTENLWMAQKGQCRIGQRDFLIETAAGHPRRLSVGVQGKTADALDVLQELWAFVFTAERSVTRTPDDRGPPPNPGHVQSLGRLMTVTTAVVKLPFRVDQLFPQADFLREQVRVGLDTGFKLTREPVVRFGLELKLEWGVASRTLGTTVTFEPRVGDKHDSKLFFTRSPLPSDEHLKVVEQFVEQFKPR